MPGRSVPVSLTQTSLFSKICWQISAFYGHMPKKPKGQFSCGCSWGAHGVSQMLWREHQALHLHLCDPWQAAASHPTLLCPYSQHTHSPSSSHSNPNLIVWMFPTTLMWLSECSSSALSALEVTGDKAAATAKDQALVQPQCHPPFLSPWPWRQPKGQSPGSSLLGSPSNLPLSSSAPIYCICKAFLCGHQLGRGRGEQGGHTRQEKRDGTKNLEPPRARVCGQEELQNAGRKWPLNSCAGAAGRGRLSAAAHGEI